MQGLGDQLPSKSLWAQPTGFSFPQSFFGQPQKMAGLFPPDEADAIVNVPGFYLADDLAHLFNNNSFPSTDEVTQSPRSSYSSQTSDGCRSSLDDDGTHAVACLQSNSRKMVALAPAQPKSPPSGDLQLMQGSRYHKRREQNRAAQRAFRRRKEQHLKDLEDRVVVLESTKAKITAENARLQEDLERAMFEHSFLEKLAKSNNLLDCADRSEHSSTSTPCRLDGGPGEWFESPPGPPPTSRFEPRSLVGTQAQSCGHELNGGQIWELIIGHQLFQEGLADVDTIAQEVWKLLERDKTGGITEAILIECIQKSGKPRQEGYN